MTEPWEKPDKKQLSVFIEKELYQRVKKHFHYGQFSKLFRNIFESIDQKITKDELLDIVNYIYKEKELILTPVEDDHDINGQD